MYSQELLDSFSKMATASIADACEHIFGRRSYMSYDMKNRINEKKIVGAAVTVLEGPSVISGPPSHAIEAIDHSNPGDVLVISLLGSDKDVAIFGGLMAAGAFVNKMAGVILDAGVRDVTEIRRDYKLPIYARSMSPGTTVGRYRSLESNIPVTCGGIVVTPGDLVVADIDGVVVVPQQYVEDVQKEAQLIEEREAAQTKIILESGSLATGLNAYGRI